MRNLSDLKQQDISRLGRWQCVNRHNVAAKSDVFDTELTGGLNFIYTLILFYDTESMLCMVFIGTSVQLCSVLP